MCGIAGIVDATGAPVEPAVLRRMCAAMRHRGPDDEGIFLNPAASAPGRAGPAVGLAAVRLSIIDLAGGHQPMPNEDESVWVILNGEIYNFQELRAELERRGHRFRSRSDTETVAHAYEEYGVRCVERLRGMFAFALWDEREQLLLLARDRVGKKPLIYSEVDGRLAFASEFAALFQHLATARRVDLEALVHYLTFLFVPTPLTAFAGVQKLPPGHVLVWQRGRVRVERYWTLDFSRKLRIGYREAVQEVRRLLEDAVRVRLVSDVPLGAFLSGGLDSSTVVALMSRLLGRRVKTFSIGFEEAGFDELPYARLVAQRYATEHHEAMVKPDAVELLPALVARFGEPFADSSAIPTFYLSRMTRQQVTVALTGDGGDEVFAGYYRHAAMRLADRYQALPAAVRLGVLAPVASLLDRPLRAWRALSPSRFVRAAGLPREERFLRWMGAFTDDLKLEILNGDAAREAAASPSVAVLSPLFRAAVGLDGVDAALAVDTAFYLPNDLLVKLDITSMACSLEARAPLLDHLLMEFVASLPARWKARGLSLKALLKDAIREWLPPEILRREKHGFSVPIGQWFRGPLRELLEETLFSQRAAGRGYFDLERVRGLVQRHMDGRDDLGQELWTLLVLELWHRLYIDGVPEIPTAPSAG